MKTAIPQEPASQVHLKLKNHEPVKLIDVRSPGEYADGHALGARSIPLDEINREQLNATLGSDVVGSQQLYLICESGVRAQQAFKKLADQGLDNLALVKGGTDAWRAEGLPVKRTSKLLSLERQTQIALGGLLLLLLFKGVVIHPLFYAVIGLMGLGLITAGVTARCGLSAIIARMPWNQPGSNSPA